MPFLFACQKEEIILPSYTLLSTICVTVSHNYLHTAFLLSLIPDKQKIKLTLRSLTEKTWNKYSRALIFLFQKPDKTAAETHT